MPAITPIVAAVTMVLILIGTFTSFIGVKLDNPPKQHISPVTGYPTWHASYKDYSDELSMAFSALALIFASFSAFAAWRATRPPSRSLTGWVSKDGREETSFQINVMIKYYVFVTWVAIFGYMFLDVGKIWAVVGALHNLLEVALLVLLVYGGRVTSLRYGLYMFAYVVITIVVSEYGPWPIDAVFFRWQGLCSDFGLVIVFTRIYFSTKKQLSAFGNPNLHDKLLKRQQRAVDQNASAVANAAVPQSCGQQQPQDPERLSTLERIKRHLVAKAPTPEEAHHHQEEVQRRRSHEQQPAQQQQQSDTPRRSRLQRLFSDDSSSSSDSSDDEHDGIFRNPFHRSNPKKTKAVTQNGHHHDYHEHTNDRASSSTDSSPISPQPSGITTISIPPPPVSVNDIVQQSRVQWGVKWHNPDQLLLLVFGAFFHVLGNCFTTIWSQSVLALAAFQISYGLSFPLYAYYLYVDNHALRQTKVYLPDFSWAHHITYGALSMLGSTVTIRLGLLVAAANKAKETVPSL